MLLYYSQTVSAIATATCDLRAVALLRCAVALLLFEAITEAGKGGREDSLDVAVQHQSAAGPCAPSGLANALMYLQRPLECVRSFKASSMGRGDSGHAPLLPLEATYLKGEKESSPFQGNQIECTQNGAPLDMCLFQRTPI